MFCGCFCVFFYLLFCILVTVCLYRKLYTFIIMLLAQCLEKPCILHLICCIYIHIYNRSKSVDGKMGVTIKKTSFHVYTIIYCTCSGNVKLYRLFWLYGSFCFCHYYDVKLLSKALQTIFVVYISILRKKQKLSHILICTLYCEKLYT